MALLWSGEQRTRPSMREWFVKNRHRKAAFSRRVLKEIIFLFFCFMADRKRFLIMLRGHHKHSFNVNSQFSSNLSHRCEGYLWLQAGLRRRAKNFGGQKNIFWATTPWEERRVGSRCHGAFLDKFDICYGLWMTTSIETWLLRWEDIPKSPGIIRLDVEVRVQPFWWSNTSLNRNRAHKTN